MDDSVKNEEIFDQNLSNIDLDALGDIDFSKIKISDEDVKEVLNDETVEITPPKTLKPQYLQTEQPGKPIKEKKTMNSNTKKVLESMGVSDDDETTKDQMETLWDAFKNQDEATQYKIQVHRIEPQILKGTKIAGYLKTFYLPITIPDIIEEIGRTHAGGRYKLQIVDASGKYIKSKLFEIAGSPKIPEEEERKEEMNNTNQNQNSFNTTSSSNNQPQLTPNYGSLFKKQDFEEEDSLEDESGDDELEYSGFFKKSPLRPRAPGGFNQGFHNSTGFGSGFRRNDSEEELERTKKDLENKIDSKFEKLNEKLTSLLSQRKDTSGGLLSPELLQAAMPLIGTFMENRSSKDNMLASQFSEMNNRMMSLFNGLQEMTRMNEKSREEIIEKERREREAARKELLEIQAKMEEKHRDHSEKQEARFREMMTSMQQSLEKKHSDEHSSQRSLRDEYEKQREEARRRQDEFFEKMRQKEEESRIKIEEIREQARRNEIEKERELRKQELEVIERVRALELEKLQSQQDQIRKNYAENIETKGYEHRMQLALGNLAKERDSQLQELKAQMEIEKLRNDAKLELARIKQESEEKKGSDDAFDKIMADYLRRRLQIMMMRDLEGVEAESDEDSPVTPGKVFNNVLNRGSEALGVILQQILKGSNVEEQNKSRIVEPRQTQTRVNPVQKPSTQSAPAQSAQPQTEQTVPNQNVVENTDSVETVNPSVLEGVDLSALGALGPELLEEIEKIKNYFDYLKEAISSGQDPKEAAEIGKEQLLPPIVDYLGTIQDSRIVIQELQGMLDDQETVEFFLQENSVKWLDELLTHFKNK